MSASAPSAAVRQGSAALWTGRILSGLVTVFLLLDGGMKLVPLQPVIDTSAALGLPTDDTSLRSLGVLALGCALLYAWPRTAVLGAVLLTAYLGGAIATHFRVASPLLTHTMFGVYVGVLAWAGLWLRDGRLRTLLPLRSEDGLE